MTAMDGRQSRGMLLWCFALFLLLFLTRAVFARMVLSGHYVTIDEVAMTLATLDRFVGLPHTEQQWPGASLQLASLPVLGGYLLMESLPSLGLGSFAAALSAAYRDPLMANFLARLVVAGVFSIGVVSLLPWTARRIGNPLHAVMILVAVACVPEVWHSSYTAIPGGFATGMSCLAITLLVTPDRPRVGWAGALIGIALAARTIHAPVVLLTVGLVLVTSPRRWNDLAVFIAFVAIGFIATCPYVWVDPLRFLKAQLGNLAKHGPRLGTWHAIKCMFIAVPPWIVLLAIAAVAWAGRRNIALTLCVLAAWGILFLASAVGVQAEPRYFVLLPWLLVVYVIAVVPPVGPRTARIAIGVLVVCLAVQVYFHQRWVGQLQAIVAERHGVVEQVLAVAQGGRVVVPQDLELDFVPHASSASLLAIAQRCEVGLAGGQSVIKDMASYGYGADVAASLAEAVNENERCYAARMRLAALGDRPGVNLGVYCADASAVRYGQPNLQQSLDDLRAGRVDLVVVQVPPPADLTVVASVGDTHVLRRGGGSKAP